MSNNYDWFKDFEKIRKQRIRAKNQRIRERNRRINQSIRENNLIIKEENRRILEENQQKVYSWNEELKNDYRKIENAINNITLKKFDSEKYYQELMEPLKIDKYIPLPKPNENDIRKKVGCLKENKLLEHFSKTRTEKRIQKGKEFEKIWKKENEKYLELEQKHFDEYAKYKNDEIKKNKEVNKDIYLKKEKYQNNDSEEIIKIIGTIINDLGEFGYGKTININYDAGNVSIDYQFLDPQTELNNIKEYRFIKTRNDVKELYFSQKELENYYEIIVFNIMLTCAAKLMYFINEKINNMIVNGYVEKINPSNGNKEKHYIFSCKLKNGDIPFDKLYLIDSKSFFDSHGARYSLPLVSIKKIRPFEFNSEDLMGVIDSNNINGFDFEKLSKTLLEKNGFDNVEVTKASGDYGADVIAFKDGVKYAVQCKKFSSPVGVKAVQEVIASKSMYHCHVGVVLTNNYFTPNAIKLAESNGILLWNKVKLDEMIEKSELDSNKTLSKINFTNVDSSNINSIDYSNELESEEDLDANTHINRELEDRMNNLDLEDWQKDLVCKGEYDPENFEEEDLEEDDYYYDDVE